MSRNLILVVLFFLARMGAGIPSTTDFQVVSLPLTCAELLPDTTPYLIFIEAVARGQVLSDRRFSKRIYRILALRDRMVDVIERGRDQNPIDTLVRKTLCFYREKKEPLKPISYDDAQFLAFLKSSIKDLEKKVDDSVFEWEFERQKRIEFERRALRNQARVNALVREADLEANQVFEKLSMRAKKKAKMP